MPEHDWMEWRFQHEPLPYSWWKDTNNQLKFLEGFKRAHNINVEDDWYSVSYQQIAAFGGLAFFEYRNK
jgi:hypothetical protein